MRQIVSPLSGLISPLGQLRSSTSLSAYAVNNFDPSLVFDFEQNYYRTGGEDSTLSNSVTHTRASSATMTNSSGTLVTVGNNVARVGHHIYNGSAWVNEGILHESEARTNLITYSSDFTNSSYSKGNVTIGSDNIVAPDGTTTADTLTATGSSYIQSTLNSANTSIGYTLSVWMKVPSGTTPVDMGNIDAGVYVTKTVTTDWQLFSITQTPSATTRYPRVFRKTSGDVTVHIWGAHVYRSDLGGMVDNPAQSTGLETYVPTTSSAVYLPRVGHHVYNGSAWVNEGVLHESEARTNLAIYSEDFSQWLKGSNTTVTAGFASPDGGSNAYRLEMAQASGTFMRLSTTLVSGSDYTFSIYVKDNGTGTGSQFILDTVQVGGGLLITATDEWVRYSITFQANTTSVFANIDNGTHSSGTDLLIYGAQVELGTTPSSYIPTSGSTATRAAETLTVPAANLPYSSTNMSIQMDGRMTYADNSLTAEVQPYRWQLDNGNYILLGVQTTNTRTGQIAISQRAAGSGLDYVSGAIDTYTPDINVPFNVASRHGSTFLNGAHESTLLTANTTPTALPDLSSTNLQLGYIFMGTIGKFRVWSDDLTDTGIATASAPSTEPSLQLTFDGSSTSSFKVLDWSE